MKYLDDEVYLEKIRAGNVQAYSFLVNKHKSLAFTLALRMVRNREDAEEIAQDAFLKAYHALPEFKGDSKFSTWLFRIVYNNSINKLRKNVKATVAIDEQAEYDLNFAEMEEELKILHAKERRLYVKEAIDTLDEEEGVIITLFYIEELPSATISEITGLTDANIRVKLHRARKKLQLILQNKLKGELKELL
ncbi:MAG: sigma-70 family RNA polymerase sigma factor [Bacteroidota bacterium]